MKHWIAALFVLFFCQICALGQILSYGYSGQETGQPRTREYREALKTALSGRFAAAAASFSGTRKELNEAMRLSIRERKASLDTLIRETEALSPLAVLSRGYSVTTDADGRIIRNRGDATPGQEIVTRLMDGELRSIVKEG